MAIAEQSEHVPSAGAPAAPRGQAFGLDVRANFEVPALGPIARARAPRRTVCREAVAADLDRGWPAAESQQVVDRRFPDGRLFMGISGHPELGYRIWAPRYGRHHVSADGQEIRSALPRGSSLGWQRLFFAQTLPLAAALQGLEVLHASAVGIAGQAVAFTGASRAGKSSLAAHLVASGAAFLTDDVLALEHARGRVIAHAGPARAAVSRAELRAMTPLGRRRLGRRVASSDKVHFEPALSAGPLPLAVLYRAMRDPGALRLRVRERVPPDPPLVLGSCFLPYLQTPGRLLAQFAVCEGIVESVRVFDLRIPAGAPPVETAKAVLSHLGGVLSS